MKFVQSLFSVQRNYRSVGYRFLMGQYVKYHNIHHSISMKYEWEIILHRLLIYFWCICHATCRIRQPLISEQIKATAKQEIKTSPYLMNHNEP